MSNDRPRVKLQPGGDKRAMLGHPWIFSNELAMDAAIKALPPGEIVTIIRPDGRPLGAAFFNPHSLIAARLLTRDAEREIDEKFLFRRLERALKLRERVIGAPFYRLIHAEADGIPGCIIDRFGDVVVVEPNAAGADRLTDLLVAALDRLLKPRAIVISGDGPARNLEGIAPVHRIAKGAIDGAVELQEHGARFLADLAEGQKTGWFYDQRDNRLLAARFAEGADVLDLYSYSGGFGVQAARHGAKSVLSVDRSQPALELARRAAALNDAGDRASDRERRGVRVPGAGRRRAPHLRSGDGRSAGLREVQEGLPPGRPRLSQAGAPLRRARAHRRVHVPGVVLAPHAGRRVPRPGRARPARGRPLGPHPPCDHRRAGSPGAPDAAGERLSEGAAAAGGLGTPPHGTIPSSPRS